VRAKLWVLLVSSLTAALLQASVAGGQQGVTTASGPSIWFRSSDGCPDGTAFLARLRGAASGAYLAGAGDRIDFVVTLGAHGPESSGRLERQTSGGTVAVRELTAASCEEVADALALTLGLALDPSSVGTRGAVAPSNVSEESDSLPLPLSPQPPIAERPANSVEANESTEAARRPAALRFGGQFGLLSRALPSQALMIGAFAEIRPQLAALRRATARLTGVGAWSDQATAPNVDMTILALRLELCPTAVQLGRIQLSPCLGAEGGSVSAETPDSPASDQGFWGALVGHARVRLELVPSVAIEAQAGGMVPLVRYALRSRETDREVYRAETLGISASAGVALGLP
jgi:hypothetical protein